MALPFTYANLTTAQMSSLDTMFQAVGLLGAVPCTVAGANTLTLSPNANTPVVSVLANYTLFSGVVVTTNTAAVSVAIGGLTALPLYKDTPAGPANLIAGDLVASDFLLIAYDSALNSGNGGFHLLHGTEKRYQVTGQVTVTNSAGVTLTAAQITGSGIGFSVISRAGSPGGGISDTTDIATNILAAMPGAVVGSTFRVRVSNATGQTVTLLGGTGVTVVGTATTATGTTHEFEGVITATGTPAITVYG